MVHKIKNNDRQNKYCKYIDTDYVQSVHIIIIAYKNLVATFFISVYILYA